MKLTTYLQPCNETAGVRLSAGDPEMIQ